MNPTEALSARLNQTTRELSSLKENHSALAKTHLSLRQAHDKLIDESLAIERSRDGYTEAIASFCSSCATRDLPGCSDCPLFPSRSIIERR
jgi:Rad3-related DNA helicase